MPSNSSALMQKQGLDIVHRWNGNPLIDIGSLDFKCSDIHNAGVVCYQSHILLLVTIEHLSGQRCIHIARPGENGCYCIDETPFMKPRTDPKNLDHESHGVLDARVTFIDNSYLITYNALGQHGYRLGIARTNDFVSVEYLPLASEPDTKAGVLFPKKINHRYARLEKPAHGHSIWISYSDDLVYWGQSELIISPRSGFWDSTRIGAAAVPIPIDHGWLVLYYGVKETSAGPIYRIGAVILDRDNPKKVVGRAGIPILSPREKYERIGDIPNIVFCTGAIAEEDGTLKIVYGAADSCICIGSTTIEEIITHCMQSKGAY